MKCQILFSLKKKKIKKNSELSAADIVTEAFGLVLHILKVNSAQIYIFFN